MGPGTTLAIGRRAEQWAFDFLVARDLCAVARNFRCRGGEIDLIMLDRDCLTFVEVRYRVSTTFTMPSHTVDIRKQNKIIRAAAMFVAKNRRFATHTMRFDVVAIDGDGGDSIQWIKDAFRPTNSIF